MDLPALIETEEQLDDVMSRPTPALVDWARRLDGDLVILGIGGKMGNSLGRLAARAIEAARRRGGRARVGPARARGAGRDAASDAAARSEEAASMCGGGVARSRRTMMSRHTRRFVGPDFLIF